MAIGGHERIGGFSSWEELWLLLQHDWVRLDDDERGLTLEREGDELLVVEADRRLGVRQRRELLRIDFRPVTASRVTVWCWDAREAAHPDEGGYLSSSSKKAGFSRSAAALPTNAKQRMKARLLTVQTQRVVREVFRSRLQDVTVTIRCAEEW